MKVRNKYTKKNERTEPKHSNKGEAVVVFILCSQSQTDVLKFDFRNNINSQTKVVASLQWQQFCWKWKKKKNRNFFCCCVSVICFPGIVQTHKKRNSNRFLHKKAFSFNSKFIRTEIRLLQLYFLYFSENESKFLFRWKAKKMESCYSFFPSLHSILLVSLLRVGGENCIVRVFIIFTHSNYMAFVSVHCILRNDNNGRAKKCKHTFLLHFFFVLKRLNRLLWVPSVQLFSKTYFEQTTMS